MRTNSYGYKDPELVDAPRVYASRYRWLVFILAALFIISMWLALDQKLLFGKDWMSETYDNPDWRTNEGNLHTYGAWDLEEHVWKTEFVMKNFPNFHWNPYWYLGMPLLKYYQMGFYFLHWLVISITGLTAAKAATMLLIFSHLIAVFLTFLLCYKVSKRIWVSALCSTFVLSSTFITLRSYGWEPITVVFLFLFPLGLLLFLREPLRPFRFWLVLVLGVSYISHPLLWFSLCMTMGIYLISIAIRSRHRDTAGTKGKYLWQYFMVVICSIFIGAIQSFPQLTYHQVTSGAHMGLGYLPFYQVPPNIISLRDFFFDAGNLKGPGPIILIASLLLVVFTYMSYRNRITHKLKKSHNHEMIAGLTIVLFMMVLFYYIEFYNIFPMNILRSIQYHRIIPEFIITAAVLVAALSNVMYGFRQKVFYYAMLISFVLVTGIIIYNVQAKWATTDTIMNKQEIIHDKFLGRISFPYTDQSLSVRNSFTFIPQSYGYYEQGITNPYNDEIFSVSSGFHNSNISIIYLKAANVVRLYVNTEEGQRDSIVMSRMNSSLQFVKSNQSRYSYFEIPIADASLAQAVDGIAASNVQKLTPGCRNFFKDKYCGSVGEEFVGIDTEESHMLSEYVNLLEKPYEAKANIVMIDPDHYRIDVTGASESTAVVIKMTYDKDFVAKVKNQKISIEPIGPYFMLLRPKVSGDYTIELDYRVSGSLFIGIGVSILSIFLISVYFLVKNKINLPNFIKFKKGDM